MNERDPNRTVIKYANGFTMVHTRTFEMGTKTYILPSQCEKVFCSQVPGKAGCLYVAIYDPRGRPVNHNVIEEDDIEEE
jgi:hypothetical protein